MQSHNSEELNNITNLLMTYSFFYRHTRINPVIVIKINVVYAKTLKTRLAASPHIFRLAIQNHASFIDFDNSKFCGQLDFFSWQFLQGLQAINSL